MKLEPSDKLILTMLCEIHSKLEIKGGVDPTFIKKSICSNSSWAIPLMYVGIFDCDEEDTDKNLPEYAIEVRKILNMWRCIEQSTNGSTFDKLSFRGFDANNESDHYRATRVYIKDLKLFEEFKSRELNSHFPLLEKYRQMLALFNVFKNELVDFKLTCDQLEELNKIWE